jgi:hypothetical protein
MEEVVACNIVVDTPSKRGVLVDEEDTGSLTGGT